MNMNKNQDFYSTKEASDVFEVSQSYISRLCRKGYLPSARKKEDGSWEVPKNELQLYLLGTSKNAFDALLFRVNKLALNRPVQIFSLIFSIFLFIAAILGFIVDWRSLFPEETQSTQVITATLTPLTINAPNPTPMPIVTPSPQKTSIAISEINTHEIGLGTMCNYGKLHSIVRDINGILHVFYKPIDQANMFAEIISNDNGLTWDAPSIISGFEAVEQVPSFGCSAVAALDGTIHLVFNIDYSSTYYTRWNPSAGWSDPISRGEPTDITGTWSPNIVSDNFSQIHIVWSGRSILYSFFEGEHWIDEKIIAPGGWHPDIYIDIHGNRHIVYNSAGLSTENETVEVFYTNSEDGVLWKESEAVNDQDRVWTGGASIVVDLWGRRHVVFNQKQDLEGRLLYSYSDDGEAWTKPFQINELPGVQIGQTGKESASIAIDHWGNIYVVWKGLVMEDDSQQYHIFLRYFDRKKEEWSVVMELGKTCNHVGCNTSIPYGLVGQPNDTFYLDVLWQANTNTLNYTQVIFKPEE
ncbi:MAG: hypothetical protein PVF83_13705 [Anaerolineales bacterium]|jgi:hypothetical protein